MDKRLTFEEFMHLSNEEKGKRAHEMSDHDRFLARMNDWGAPDPTGQEPYHWKPTEEELDELLKIGRGESKPKKKK